MTEKPEIRIISAPLGDTGLGREAGFKDDAELIAAAKAERDALSPEMRKLADQIDADWERAVLFGEQPTPNFRDVTDTEPEGEG